MPFSKFNYLITVPDLQPTPARPLHLSLTKITVFPVKSLFSTKLFTGHAAMPLPNWVLNRRSSPLALDFTGLMEYKSVFCVI